jgi:hypothetical protein
VIKEQTSDVSSKLIAASDHNLDLAAGVIMLKSIRMFFNTSDGEPHGPGAEGLIENWRKLSFDDRVSALIEFQKQVWEAVLEGLQPIRKGAVWHG